MVKKSELILKCSCVQNCGLVTFENLDHLDMKGEIAIEFFQKKRVRGNAIIINEEQTKELINFLEKQLEATKMSEYVKMNESWDAGLRCGNCIHYFCDEFDGDQCDIMDFELNRRQCKSFKSWRDK